MLWIKVASYIDRWFLIDLTIVAYLKRNRYIRLYGNKVTGKEVYRGSYIGHKPFQGNIVVS